MRALTIRQPWAWAVFNGKPVENRSWATSQRGELGIHAGVHLEGQDSFREVARLATAEMPMFGLPKSPVTAQLGGFIGLADLVDVHWWQDCRAPGGGLCSPRAQLGQWHWVLRQPMPLARFVECPGRQRIWYPSAKVLGQVRAAVR